MASWTNEQKDAINSDGENIIVSAGAGSGKTMVLTNRVIRKLESGISIQNLLILTFTKLAANEMKKRIRDAIKERIELSDELKKIDNSYITTFDSFSLSLVKKYHYLLDVKKDVNIIDSNLLNIKTKEYLDIILEEEYKEKKDDFTKLINDFCLKDDNNIKEIILSINEELNLKYDKEEYLNNYIKKYYTEDFIKENILSYIDYLKDIIFDINSNLTKISSLIDDNYYHELKDLIMPVINSSSYEEIAKSVNSITRLPNLPRGSGDEAKEIKEKLNNKIKLLKELTKISNTTKLLESIELTEPYVKAIIRIIQNLDKKINEYKFNNDLYDFIDICKMAIKLVKEHKNIQEEIKNSFNEIMIDEYQDTSDLQEEFINLISDNNVYVVGDVKQSIYRFRNANPNLFRYKYNKYSEGIDGKKIDLLKNFRSRKEVLDNINLIFNYIMSELIGGANYKDSHQMIPGNDSYLENKDNYNLDILSYDDTSITSFNREEIEAFIIANDIKKRIDNHYQVFDKKSNKLRDVTYSDFVILIDRSSSFTTFKKIFLYHKIPLSIYQDEYLTSSSLFMVIKNILKLINLIYENIKNKEIAYTFLSIGRSFLFNYSDEYLFNVVVNKDYNKTDIFEKIKKVSINLSAKSISSLLDEIISEFDIYEKIRRIPDIENNYTKLEYLYNLSRNFNQMGYTILDFLAYLDNIIDSKMDIKFSINKIEEESAKIMTIHASKGLEYPICYYPGLYKGFNTEDIKSKIIFNNRLGIITPVNNEGIMDTFYKELFKRDYLQDEVSEKIRLLYVALTRAKEKMIFVIPNTLGEEEYDGDLVTSNIRLCYHSFLDMINSIKSKLTDYIIDIDLTKIGLTKAYSLINSDNLFNNLSKNNQSINLINYPKYASSIIEEQHFSKESIKIFTQEEKEKMEFGTKIHYCLETLDLKNPDLSDINSSYKEKIISFLKCDLLNNISKAKIYQEYEFIENNSDKEKHGIIDLMLEYSDYIDIIDYKLKNISDEAYIKQLNGYKEYIERITNKKTNIYLYSIMDENYKKI